MAKNNQEILTAIEIDAITGEQIIRPLTSDEITERLTAKQEHLAAEATIKAKAAARQSALAKLKELGLTEAEIAAL